MVNKKVYAFYHILPGLFIRSAKELGKNDPLRMAAATAFFTSFALAPIIILMTQILGVLFEQADIREQLFQSLSGIVGETSMLQIAGVIEEIRATAKNWVVTVGGFLFLIFIATTLFNVVKHSINQIWKIRENKKRNMLSQLSDRLRSILVIIGTGVLFVIGLAVEGVQALLGQYVEVISPVIAGYFTGALNYLVSIIIVTGWFAILFRFIPDARPAWRTVLSAAFITSILFNIGKVLLRLLLGYSNINNIYGASGSIVLLLLFVFYSSFILYFGAALTKILSHYNHTPIKPRHYAIGYQLTEIEHTEDEYK